MSIDPLPRVVVLQAGTAKLTVSVRRGETLTEALRLRVRDLGADVTTAGEVILPEGSSEGEMTLSAGVEAIQGPRTGARIDAFAREVPRLRGLGPLVEA